MANYVSHSTPTEISAISRCAIKVKDTYYTVEASEKRAINNLEGLDLDKEYEMLFDRLNAQVDSQCEDIIKNA